MGRLKAQDEKQRMRRAFNRAQQWIPVTERLPDTDKDVLVYATTKFIGGFKIAIDKLEEGEQHPIWLYTHGWFEVTHWMPLPEPPESEGT